MIVNSRLRRRSSRPPATDSQRSSWHERAFECAAGDAVRVAGWRL